MYRMLDLMTKRDKQIVDLSNTCKTIKPLNVAVVIL
jgi:hypothetical protein